MQPHFRAAKRPITKLVKVVHQTLVGTTQLVTVLYTATFPVTITGLRILLTALNNTATTNSLAIAVIRKPHGYTVANTLNVITDGTELYADERNMMWYWVGSLNGSKAYPQRIEASTKTMRKLETGDTLEIILKAQVASCHIQGAIQFFTKI